MGESAAVDPNSIDATGKAGVSSSGASGGTSASAASSLASLSLAFKGYADYEQGKSAQAADQYKADQLDRAAEYGDLKAEQTNAQMTRNLSITLGNIDAVRAAAHTDPSSPTGAAVRGFTEEVGTENKNIKVDSIMAQAREDEANAAYLRKAGGDALLAGEITAGVDVATGVAKAVAGMPGG